MSVRQAVLTGGAVGLGVSATVLALFWRYGVWQIMFGKTDLRTLLWPSSVLMRLDWCCSVAGVLTTVLSVLINCLLYIAIALILRVAVRALLLHPPGGS